ncbi:hypothetical protein ACHAW6_002969 [Cyclotella cf. meneghiniana]
MVATNLLQMHDVDLRQCISNAPPLSQEINGAMELLQSLVCFDPQKRAMPLDVIYSSFTSGLMENSDHTYDEQDIMRSYMSYYKH